MISRWILVLWLTFNFANVAQAAPTSPQRLVVITVDGLRWQELFTGVDKQLKELREAGVKRKADHALMERLWVNNSEERRARLFPYFWNTLAAQGMLLGNRSKGSRVDATNNVLKSYPGYAEILTGQALDKQIRGNTAQKIPAPTLLEALQKHWQLPYTGVALFAAWDRFKSIAAQNPKSFVVNAGYQEANWPNVSARSRALSQRQFEQLTPWTEVRHDYITCELALDYLRQHRPRVLYLGLGETDDWAHDKRYPRVLWAATYFDTCLRKLVEWIDDDPEYKGNTLLVVSTDHGRGRTPADWHHHKLAVPGSEEAWFYMRGPGVPSLGELSNTPLLQLRDIAPTILKRMNIPLSLLPTMTGQPLVH